MRAGLWLLVLPKRFGLILAGHHPSIADGLFRRVLWSAWIDPDISGNVGLNSHNGRRHLDRRPQQPFNNHSRSRWAGLDGTPCRDHRRPRLAPEGNSLGNI
jgi:hypothetical protein